MLNIDHDRKAVRQGDLLVVPVKPPQRRGKPLAQGHVVLQEGELTGHSHAIDSPRATMFLGGFFGGNRPMLPMLHVDGDAPVSLVHEDHLAKPIDPGYFDVVPQRTRTAGMVKVEPRQRYD